MKKTSVLILIVLGLALSLPLHGAIAQANDSMEAKQDSSVTDTIRLRGCRVGTPNPHFSPRRAKVLSGCGSTYNGDRRQLVVLVSFQDQDFAEDHDAALAKRGNIFNVEGYSENGYVGSVHDYFLAQSYGQFRLMFDLMFVELPDSCKKYRSTTYDDENSQYMVDEIVDTLLTRDVDWSLYDWNGDRFVIIRGQLLDFNLQYMMAHISRVK